MKNLFITLFVCMFAMSFSQSFQTGTITLTFNDPARTGGFGSGGGAGRQIQTEIYYPAVSGGSNVAVASGSFPVVVFGHGFVMSWDSYNNVYSELSKRGYIVALPRTEGGTGPNHLNFGLDLALVASRMLQLNSTNTLAPIFSGKVAQKVALAGHSMGGGSSFLGAKNNNSITCVFNFAAAQTNPAASEAAKNINVPVLIIGGEADCVAPPATHQDKMWDSTASAKKFEVIIKDLTHCDFGNGSNFNCNFGQNSSGCPNSVSNTTALKLYMNFVNPFLDNLLKDNCAAGTMFMDSVTQSQVIFSKKISGSIACINTALNDENYVGLEVFPNPVKDEVIIGSDIKIQGLRIFSYDGKLCIEQKVNSGTVKVNTAYLLPGVYFLVIENENGSLKRRKIIRQ